nr:hypothetical protein [Micromonospora sp. DSM 115978]
MVDEAAERGDPGGRLGPADDLGAVDVVRRRVGQGAAAFVLELDAWAVAWLGGHGRVAAAQGLQVWHAEGKEVRAGPCR